MSRKQPLISAIIPTYRDEDCLKNCISSLKKSASAANIPIEIIIIINNTNFRTFKEKYFSDCKLLINKKNAGFTKSLNQGANIAKGKWLLFINADTITRSRAIKYLISHTKENNTAIIAPIIYHHNNKLQFTIMKLPSVFGVIFEQSYLYKILSFIFPQSPAHLNLYKYTHQVDAVEGTYYLVNRACFKKIRGFDSRFFIYFEDMDLCKRIKDLGYKIIFEPKAKVIHFGQQSSGGVMRGDLYLNCLYKYLLKYYSKFYASITILFLALGSLLRLIYWKIRIKTTNDEDKISFGNKKIIFCSQLIKTYRKLTENCFNIFLLFVFSLVVFLIFLSPFIIHNTDEFDYITGSILLRRDPLAFGRFLHILLYHSYLRILSFFINIEPLKAYLYLKLLTIFISAITVCLWFSFLKSILKSKYIALASCLILFTNYTFLRYSGSVMPEISSLFMLVFSLYLLEKGIFDLNKKRIFFSAIILGLGFNFREQTIYYLPWAVLLLSSYKKLTCSLLIKFLTLLIFSAIIPPFFIYLTDKTNYVRDILLWNKYNDYVAPSLVFARFELFLNQFNVFIIISSLIGILNTKFSRLKLLLLLIPFIITIILVPPSQERYFIPLWLPVSLLAASGIYKLLELSNRFFKYNIKNLHRIYFATIILYVFFTLNQYYFLYLPSDNQNSSSYKKYSEILLNNFSQKALFLVGDKTWLIDKYLKPLAKPGWRVIYSGWGWPGKKRLIAQIQNSGMKHIYIDPSQYSGDEKEDLDNLLPRMELRPFVDGIYAVETLKE